VTNISTVWHRQRLLAVAPEAVWQVWRPPYKSEVWCDTNLLKFGQLILKKVIETVATRCQILRLKCNKIDFGWCFAPDLTSWNKGALLLREGEGKEREGEEEVKEREGREEDGKEGREREVREGRGKGAGKGRRKDGKGKKGKRGKGERGGKGGEGRLAIPILICFRRHCFILVFINLLFKR